MSFDKENNKFQNIKDQYGGFFGAILSSHVSNNIYENDRYEKSSVLKRFIKIIFNYKLIISFIILLIYIFLGGLLFRYFEESYESTLNENYKDFFITIKNNITVNQYNNIFEIGGIVKPKLINNYWSDLNNAMFFSFTLISTIGYGNKVPLTDNGKIFSIFYIFLAYL